MSECNTETTPFDINVCITRSMTANTQAHCNSESLKTSVSDQSQPATLLGHMVAGEGTLCSLFRMKEKVP